MIKSIQEANAKSETEPMSDLCPHYYGEVPADPTLGREVNLCKFECHKCKEEFPDNITFYSHMKVHPLDRHLPGMLMCKYSVLQLRDQSELDTHIMETHNHTARPLLCRLCMINFNTRAAGARTLPWWCMSHLRKGRT